jgi:hypothetical protein
VLLQQTDDLGNKFGIRRVEHNWLFGGHELNPICFQEEENWNYGTIVVTPVAEPDKAWDFR